MTLRYQEGFKPEWLDAIIDLHNKTPMARSPEYRDVFLRAYANRFAVITCWNEVALVGFGTMISDGAMYSSIYDLVIDPDFQKQGIGREIMRLLTEKAPKTMIHLTSTFGNEDFYKKIGFKRHKTAFAKYPWKSDYLEES